MADNIASAFCGRKKKQTLLGQQKGSPHVGRVWKMPNALAGFYFLESFVRHYSKSFPWEKVLGDKCLLKLHHGTLKKAHKEVWVTMTSTDWLRMER